MEPFYVRLRKYYLNVAEVLRGQADAAQIFPNTTDKGMAREGIYAEFLRKHAPSKCNVFFGGYLFGLSGSESKQIDVIVTTDTAPRFNFLEGQGFDKSFSPVEGTIAVASSKSKLDKKELLDALENFASIPPTVSLENRVNILTTIKNYDEWPFKILFARDSIDIETLMEHFDQFYRENVVPLNRRPNLIHVAGKYCLFRPIAEGVKMKAKDGRTVDVVRGQYCMLERDPDLQAILWALHYIQQFAAASSHILYSYSDIIDGANGVLGELPNDKPSNA